MENSLNHLFDLFESLREQMSWKAVFGQPQTQGERTIIPVASITSGLGMGFGWETGEEALPEPDTKDADQTRGAGGGTGIMSRPVAVIEITPEKTTVRPIIDYVRLILAGMLALAWIASLWSGVLNKLFRLREAQQS